MLEERSWKEGLEEDVGHGGWLCGHSPRRCENPEAGEAKGGWEEKDSRAQEQDFFLQRTTWSPPIWLQHFWGFLKPHHFAHTFFYLQISLFEEISFFSRYWRLHLRRRLLVWWLGRSMLRRYCELISLWSHIFQLDFVMGFLYGIGDNEDINKKDNLYC